MGKVLFKIIIWSIKMIIKSATRLNGCTFIIINLNTGKD